MNSLPFWKTKPLAELSRSEWESLCDHCGKCCLHKIEDIDTGKVFYTGVSCRYLDTDNGQCTDYRNRSKNVPDCMTLTADNLAESDWLPSTCSYRLVLQGRDLPEWHPLLTGKADSTRLSGNSISGRVISETAADDPEDHYIDWITP